MRIFSKKPLSAGSVIMSALIIAFASCNLAYAAVAQNGSDVKFTKHFIDSKSFTKVASGKKVNAGTVLNMQVTYMYDDKGNMKDNWNYTQWKIYRAGTEFSSTIKVTKGQYTGLKMNSKAAKSDTLVVKAHGNNASYDTKISGYLYNFKKS